MAIGAVGAIGGLAQSAGLFGGEIFGAAGEGAAATDVVVSGRNSDTDVLTQLGTAATQNIGVFALVANNLSDLANAGTARTNLGLGTAATHAATDFLLAASNLSDVASAATAINNIAPSQTGQNGKVLGTDGSVVGWVAAGGTGTVTSITFTGDGVLLSSTPSGAVTTTGTLTASLLTQTANKVLAGPTTGSAATPTFRSLVTADLPATYLVAASNLSDLTSTSTARSNLGLGTAAVQNIAFFCQTSNNLSDLASASTARTNLGLGTLATQSGTFSGTSSGTNTGDQTITLTGAVTGSGTGSFATTIATPGTLTVATTNSTATAHTHAITSSSAPGAAAAILATDASGIIGSTGTRIVKGWFTDLTVTNAIAGSITGNAATVTTNANLTGVITSSGNTTSIASQTGTGTKFVVDTSPTLVTPVLGVATITSINKMAITAPATSSTLAVADGKTATISNTLTFAGTDSSTITLGAGGTVAYLGTVQAFSKQQTLTPQALTSTSNSIAWDANNGNNASHTATENTTLANPTNLVTGTVYTFQWTQHASSAKTLAFGNKWKFAGASTVSATLSAVNIITGLYDGTNINSVMTGPFS